MNNIPEELIGELAVYLSHNDIINLCQTSKYLEEVGANPLFWTRHIRKQHKINISSLESLKMINLLLDQNLIRPIQIVRQDEGKIIFLDRIVIKITDTVGDILLQLYNIFGFHVYSVINNLANEGSGRYNYFIKKIQFNNGNYSINKQGYDLLNLKYIIHAWTYADLRCEEKYMRDWFKTPLSKILLSFDNIEIVVYWFSMKDEPWQSIITEWLTS